MVKSNKSMDDSETINPNIIRVFDFSLLFLLEIFLEKGVFFSLVIRFEKGLFTLK